MFSFEKKPKKEPYDFAKPEVEKILKEEPIAPGTGISDFQSDPDTGLSDWGGELEKNLRGEPSSILAGQKLEELPQFSVKKELYINQAAEIKQKIFRTSFEFGKLCPKEGEFDEKLMADYIRTLADIKTSGQEPMVTMQHFTMPNFLTQRNAEGKITQGAWENPEVAKHFRFYVDNVTKFLANEDKVQKALVEGNFSKEFQDKFLSEGLVRYFISINEPIMTIQNGYLTGVYPPFKRGDVFSVKKILNNIVEAHDIARNTIKENLTLSSSGHLDPQVGATYNWQYIDGLFSGVAHKIMNESYTNKMERDGTYSDFLGLQYYFRMTAPTFSTNIKGREYGDYPGFGDMYPEGIFEVLKKMNAKYPKKEIFITEFGFADKEDKRRPYWTLETLRYIIEAKKAGIPIKGVLLWSLVDNLEWNLGMSQKFGLFSEKELGQPLIPSTDGIRSWEVWQAAATALTDPSPVALQDLQKCYEKATAQYERFKKTA